MWQCVKLSDEEIKDVLAIQKRLTDKISAYQKEIRLLEQNWKILDRLVSESSFTSAADMLEERQQQAEPQEEESDQPRASDSAASEPAAPATEPGQAPARQPEEDPFTYIRDGRTDQVLASVYRTDDSINIVIAHDGAALTEETEPFGSFFLQKILGGMQKKDSEDVQNGTITQADVISYEVGTDPDTGRMQNILVRNYRDERRASEIINTAGWSFSRMLENVTIQG